MTRFRRVCAIGIAALLLAACGGRAVDHVRQSGHGGPRPYAGGPPSVNPQGFYLASSFEQPVCGNFHHPDPGCEFGTQGVVKTGSFGCRTGPDCLQIQRDSGSHMGAIKDVPVEGGHAFVGCAFKVPTLPPAGGREPFVQLMQITPSDGVGDTFPLEVRFYDDRTLALALFTGKDEYHTTWKAPVDEWFYVVVEMVRGAPAVNGMWVYGPDDRLAAQGTVSLVTAGGHRNEPRDKIGGTNDTTAQAFTYADDWYIADRNFGPLHIGADGSRVSP